MTIEQIMKWLESKNVDMWANWRISDPERRRMAAEWLHGQMDDLSRFVVKAPPYDGSTKSWDVVQ